jgi:hypothetical protein
MTYECPYCKEISMQFESTNGVIDTYECWECHQIQCWDANLTVAAELDDKISKLLAITQQ